eukprot:GHVH01010666.1.p1 GENE.GHVH01010666.1~~GHVH01010666.1.p1  ORF type:complete len:801 (+),score=133.39 GHVH01010666.1:116-2518(+)
MDHSPVQFISYDGTYNDDIEDYFEDLAVTGFGYNVCSILGCQSSGKSTLLNALFGTEFDVMDSHLGRSQTTKGLWLSRDTRTEPIDATTNRQPLLIIDVEGTDSKERGEDRVSFEHRASLFALALSDVVVMNMWYTDLGRYTASNYGLLRTVLQVNLELFGKSAKERCTTTKLVFLIRDYSPILTPMDKLRSMLFSDVATLWSEIEKPPGFEDCKATDLFSLECVGLPSYVLNADQFNEDVSNLRKCIYDKWLGASFTKKIPFDGFNSYCHSVWNTIIGNSDLDIPSQKMMLATFRCDELKNEAVKNSIERFERLDNDDAVITLPFKPLNDFLSALFNESLAGYDAQGYRYEQSIFENIRNNLVTHLSEGIQVSLAARMGPVIKREVKNFEEVLIGLLNSEGDEATPNFELATTSTRVLDDWVETSVVSLRERYGDAISASIPSVSSSLGDREERLTKKNPHWGDSARWKFNMDDIIEGVKDKQAVFATQEYEKMRDRFAVALSGHFVKNVWPMSGVDDLLLDKSINGKEFWVSLNEKLTNVMISYQGRLEPAFDTLGQSPYGGRSKSTMPMSVGAFCAWSLREYIKKFATHGDRLGRIITDRFDGGFYDDDEGVPRNWLQTTYEEIGTVYKQSRDQAFMVLDDLCKDNLLYVNDDDLTLVSPHMMSEGCAMWTEPLVDVGLRGHITELASRHMKRAVTDAQTINSTGGNFDMLRFWPYWLFVAALGYNEFIAVISSPAMLLLVVAVSTIVGGFYISGNFTSLTTILTSFITLMASVVLPFIQSLAAPTVVRKDIKPRPQ